MKTRYHYFVIMCDYTGTEPLFPERFTEEELQQYLEKPRYFADVLRVSESDNILCKFESIGGLKAANIMPNKPRAEEIAAAWNDSFKKNGTYAL